MDVGLDVLVPLVVLLGVLILLVAGLVCRFYLFRTSANSTTRYKPLNQGATKPKGYPMMPSIKAGVQAVQAIQILQKDQYSRYEEINGEKTRFFPITRAHKYDPLLASRESMFFESDELNSNNSEDSTYFSDYSVPQYTTELHSPVGVANDLKYYQNKLAKSKVRFVSDPMLYDEKNSDMKPLDLKVRRYSYASKPARRMSETFKPRRLSARPLSNINNGVIEFELLFNTEKKHLDIKVLSLRDVKLTPANFDGVLETYNNDVRRPKNKIHLVRNGDGTLTFSENFHIGYMIYIMLLPKRNFKNHTQLVFESGDVTFNETFTLSGYSAEQLSTSTLCFHSLCSFSGEEEPMVLGESKIVLSKEKFEQGKLIKVPLTPAKDVVELLESSFKTLTELGSLNVHLMYNPIAHKLIIKVIQAAGLPKIGVTGHPNTSVKTSLYFCNTRVSKKSTSIQKRQRDPIYNATIEFDLSKDRILECDVLFEIRHHGPMYRTNIGYVHVGNTAVGEGGQHWQDMLEFQRPQTTHKILPNKPPGLS